MKKTWMIAAALAVAGVASAQVDPNRVIASVNGENILGAEYYHHMEYMPGVTMVIGGQRIESTPGFFALTQLIAEHLTYQLAKDKGCMPSKQEVDDELQLRLQRDPKYIEEMADQGISQDDLMEQIKYDLAKFKIETQGITVTDQEVKQFYKEHPAEFTSEKMVKCRVIAVNSDAQEAAVDADLKAGKDFSAVAKDKSLDVTKALGGDIGTVPVSYFPAPVQTAIGSIKIGQTTNWLGVNGHKVKYQLADVQPPTLQPLDKITMTYTRRRIMLQRGISEDDLAKQITAMRAKSKVTISDKQFNDLWQQLVGSGEGS